MSEFEEQVAVVTGGAGGIGLEVVHLLLENQVKVAILDISREALKQAQGYFDGKGTVVCYQIDLQDTGSISQKVAEIRKDLGEITILVQTAGLLAGADGLTISEKQWDQMMEINARGSFFMMQQVVYQSMKKQGGVIVNVASMAGIRGMRSGLEAAHYSASKGAVVSMTQQAAVEWGKYQIRCNSVAPGGVLTPKLAQLGFPPETVANIPLGCLSTPLDIANVILFLCSSSAKMITGQTLVVDGGSSIVGY